MLLNNTGHKVKNALMSFRHLTGVIANVKTEQMKRVRAGKAVAFKPTRVMRVYLERLRNETGAPISQHVRNAVFHMMQDSGVKIR